ncbi:MAG: ComEC/Rec2 family competence protein [Candidatus Absconditabacterales bacterium]
MLFIIFFAAFIFVLTVWENIWLTGIVFGSILVVLLAFVVVKNRQKLPKIVKYCRMILLLCIAFLLAMGSWIAYNYSHGKSFENLSIQGVGIEKLKDGGLKDGRFFGTGVIQDTYTQGKYIFNDGKGAYVLYTKKEYQIGDEIFLVGSSPRPVKENPPSLRASPFTPLGAGLPSVAKGDKNTINDDQEEQGFLAFDYNKRLKMKGWEGVMYEKSSINSNDRIASLRSQRQGGHVSRSRQIKKTLQQKIISAYGKDRIAGLVLGMLIGDRSQISKDDYQGFINSGLVHIIAVSGGNIVMITVFLGFLLFFLPFYLRIFLILITVVCYGLICGLDSSVFRAVVTGGLSLVALFRGREIPVWRLLSIAFIGMLIVNPYYLVYDVGFLMSFAAVIGIILINQKPIVSMAAEVEKLKDGNMERGNKSTHPSDTPLCKGGQRAMQYIRKNYLQPSVGATCGVFPIIIFFMGKINLLSIVSNLFILPILPFVMIYGFISVYLYQFLGRNWILRIEKGLISYIYKVSEISSTFGLYLWVNGWVKWVVLLGFLLGFIMSRFSSPRLRHSSPLRREVEQK